MITRAMKKAHDKRELSIKQTFESYAKDGIDQVNVSAMKAVLSHLGFFSPDELTVVCADLDKSRDGEISLEEFRDWVLLKSSCPTVTKAKAFLAPADDDGVEGAFYNFCGPGRAEMDGRSLVKTFKDCELFDKKLLQSTVDLIFSKVKQKGRAGIGFAQFEVVLDYIADHKGVSAEEVRAAIVSHRPVYKGQKAVDVDPLTGKLLRARTTPTTTREKKNITLPRKPKVGPDRTVDNTELHKLFGVSTRAGRLLKRIYSDSVRPGSPQRAQSPLFPRKSSISKSVSLPALPEGMIAASGGGDPFCHYGRSWMAELHALLRYVSRRALAHT